MQQNFAAGWEMRSKCRSRERSKTTSDRNSKCRRWSSRRCRRRRRAFQPFCFFSRPRGYRDRILWDVTCESRHLPPRSWDSAARLARLSCRHSDDGDLLLLPFRRLAHGSRKSGRLNLANQRLFISLLCLFAADQRRMAFLFRKARLGNQKARMLEARNFSIEGSDDFLSVHSMKISTLRVLGFRRSVVARQEEWAAGQCCSSECSGPLLYE
jgi:hypothetical protein